MLRIMLFALLLALPLSTTGAAPATRGKPVTLWLQAELDIGADGRVQGLQWKESREALRLVTDRLDPYVRGWTFEPGRIDGAPQPTRTYLTLRMTGEPTAEGGIALRIGGVHTGARGDRMAHPRYPTAAMRDGAFAAVTAVVRIEPDGSAKVDSLEYRGNRVRYRADFLKAVEDAVGQSRFVHERVGDRVLAATLRIPYEFCIGGRCPEPLPAEAGGDGAQAPSGQAVALDSAVKLLDDVAGLAI